jgi:hypothetical protein
MDILHPQNTQDQITEIESRLLNLEMHPQGYVQSWASGTTSLGSTFETSSQTLTDIGVGVTVTTTKTNAKVLVIMQAVGKVLTFGTNMDQGVVSLNVDANPWGVYLKLDGRYHPLAVDDVMSVFQSWADIVTLAAVGSHTIKMQGMVYTAGSTLQVEQAKLVYVSLEN